MSALLCPKDPAISILSTIAGQNLCSKSNLSQNHWSKLSSGK